MDSDTDSENGFSMFTVCKISIQLIILKKKENWIYLKKKKKKKTELLKKYDF